MNKETTKAEQNKLIAEFMGLTVIPSGTKTMGQIKLPEIPEAFLEYNTSWDWLMPVVEKIETTNQLFIDGNACKIWTGDLEKDYIFSEENSKIEAVYQAVLQFIEYYNKLKEPKV